MVETAFCSNAGVDTILSDYSDLVYKLAFSRTKNAADAEDVFQEVFMRYISSGTEYESEEHRKAWLIRVTINCTNKLFASAWRRHRTSLDAVESLDAEAALSLGAVGSAPECVDESGVLAAVTRLPLAYRTVIHLFYYEDLSVRQISLALHKKEGTIKSQLNRARVMLKKELEREGDYV